MCGERSNSLIQIAPDDVEIPLAASVNSTMASVSSAKRRNPSPLMLMRSKPNPSGPRTKPTTVNAIGPLIRDRSIRLGTAIDQKKNREESGILVHSGQISHEK